jgi:hypothetical protein
VTGSEQPRGGAPGVVQCVVLDCPDPGELAAFYAAVLGGAVNQRDSRWAVRADFVTVHAASGLVLAFQRAADYRPPQWPDAGRPQQCHLDVEVADVDAAQRQAISLGGTLLHADPRGWRVLADPAGHPFCLVRASAMGH